MRFLAVLVLGVFLANCAKKVESNGNSVNLQPVAKKTIDQTARTKAINELVQEFKDLKYDLVCWGQTSDGRATVFALKTDGKGREDGTKITDSDAISMSMYDKEGKFSAYLGFPFNVKASHRHDLDVRGSGDTSFTSWVFQLHHGGSNPANHAVLIVDRSDHPKEGVRIRATLVHSPLLGAEYPAQELECPVFNLK